ncbi:MAG: TIM44-like domain-containing protein [Oscillospiraceae bacterium]|nr:TIM44-like domain-containing protein [Oscillospiraceae bacterium]
MRNKFAFAAIAIVAVLALAVFIPPGAFMGSTGAFDGNDFGGGWDAGGDWGGDFDFGGDGDFGDLIAILCLAYTCFGWPGVVVVILAVITAAIVTSIKKAAYNSEAAKKKRSGGVKLSTDEGKHITLPDRTGQIEGIVKAHDPNFSASDLCAFARTVYMDIETAFSSRDMTAVRPVIHDNLYFTAEKQVQSKIASGTRQYYDRMVVNTAYLTSYAKDAQYEYVTLYVNARRIEWHEDEKTGKIIRGDKTTRWDLRYKMKFMRSIACVTKEASGELMGHRCPKCFAEIKISSSGVCEFCESVVTTGQYSWVLSEYGTIRNDTVDEGVNQNNIN